MAESAGKRRDFRFAGLCWCVCLRFQKIPGHAVGGYGAGTVRNQLTGKLSAGDEYTVVISGVGNL